MRKTSEAMVVIHLMFGDDVCVFGPRISGLQNICGDYATENKTPFHFNKRIGLLFVPKV